MVAWNSKTFDLIQEKKDLRRWTDVIMRIAYKEEKKASLTSDDLKRFMATAFVDDAVDSFYVNDSSDDDKGGFIGLALDGSIQSHHCSVPSYGFGEFRTAMNEFLGIPERELDKLMVGDIADVHKTFVSKIIIEGTKNSFDDNDGSAEGDATSPVLLLSDFLGVPVMNFPVASIAKCTDEDKIKELESKNIDIFESTIPFDLIAYARETLKECGR